MIAQKNNFRTKEQNVLLLIMAERYSPKKAMLQYEPNYAGLTT